MRGRVTGFGQGEQIADAGAVQRRDELDRRVLHERQLQLQLAPHGVPLVRRQAVPLVDRDDHGPAAFRREPEQAGVLVGNAVARIQHGDHDGGGVDRTKRLDNTEFFHRV